MTSRNWFYSESLKPKGPFSVEEIKSMIIAGLIGLDQLLFSEEIGVWRPAKDWEILRGACKGDLPIEAVGGEVLPAVKKLNSLPAYDAREGNREWIVLVPGGKDGHFLQEGPFSAKQVRDAIALNAISPDFFTWRPGMGEWQQLKEVPELLCSP